MTQPVAGVTMGDWSGRRRRKAMVRKISPNFTKAIAKYFGEGPKDIELSKKAHENYIIALEKHGLNVMILPELENLPDCCFLEDAAVIVNGAALICNLGHPNRAGEAESLRKILSKYMDIIDMPDDATLDGGDVIYFDETYLIGRSTRTNEAGVRFFKKICQNKGFSVHEIDIPKSTLHLSTVCSSPKPGVLITAEGHLTEEQFNGLDAEIIWIPNNETYAANTIGFEDGSLIISDGFPKTREILEEYGFSITTVDMEHIMAADGSLTCLRLFYQ